MQASFRRLVWGVLLTSALAAQTRLHLKTGPLAQAREPEAIRRRIEPTLRRSIDRIHVLVQFDRAVSAEEIAELERRGARFVQYVPDSGYLFSVWSGLAWEGTGLQVSRFEALSKISPAMAAVQAQVEPTGEAIVEFYPDVEPEAAREIAGQAGFEVLEHPDVLSNHLLVRGRLDRLQDLAEWDEVAYVFPASPAISAGERLEACPGAITALGAVGQYVARVGEGWDGPGLGRADLGYFLQRLTQKLPADQVRSEILRALGEWSRAASLTFTPAPAPDLVRTINLMFASGSHGDGYPFDGPSRVLAHTFYPSPPNPEPIAGDLHFDDDEEWVAGPDLSVRSVDLYSVTLHELGHALGLGHSDAPGSVMYPYYRRSTVLTTEDIRAIQELYAPPSDPEPGTPPGGQPGPLALSILSPAVFPLTTSAGSVSISGTVAGGSGEIRVTWASDRGGSGVAQGGRSWVISALPLQADNNAIAITATDETQAQVSRTVLVIRQAAVQTPAVMISSPTSGASYSTASPAVTLAGTATPASGIVRVAWTNARGGTGLASGTAQWTAGPIPLQLGQNLLTVTAYNGSGASASRSLTVNYATTTDNLAPSIKITSPSSTSVLTSSAVVRLTGTATDNVAVTAVTWSTSTGKSGNAAGTTSWTADIPLLVGTNTIIVRAHDAAGNSSWRSLTATRR
jgi:hypothetical protein